MAFLFVLYPPHPSSVVALNSGNLTAMVVVQSGSLAATGVGMTG